MGYIENFTILGDQAPVNSGLQSEQRKIWKKFLAQWVRAGQMCDSCLVTGDTKLGHTHMDFHRLQFNGYGGRYQE